MEQQATRNQEICILHLAAISKKKNNKTFLQIFAWTEG